MIVFRKLDGHWPFYLDYNRQGVSFLLVQFGARSQRSLWQSLLLFLLQIGDEYNLQDLLKKNIRNHMWIFVLVEVMILPCSLDAPWSLAVLRDELKNDERRIGNVWYMLMLLTWCLIVLEFWSFSFCLELLISRRFIII